MAKTTTHAVSWLADVYQIPLGKTGHNAQVHTERLDPEVLAHVFRYGLKQILNDAAAGGKTEDEKLGLFNKRLEGLYAGNLRASRESDPVAVEAKRIAADLVSRKTGLKPGTEEFRAAVAKAMKNDAVLHLAQKAVEAKKDLDIEIEF